MPSQLLDGWRSYLPNACARFVRPAVPIHWDGRIFPSPLRGAFQFLEWPDFVAPNANH